MGYFIESLAEWCWTYGWAILVVVVAIGGLAYFGFLTSPVLTCHCSDNNLSFIQSATIDEMKYLECSERKTIIQNKSIVKITYNHLFICDEEEVVLIPYDYYLKMLEFEDA